MWKFRLMTLLMAAEDGNGAGGGAAADAPAPQPNAQPGGATVPTPGAQVPAPVVPSPADLARMQREREDLAAQLEQYKKAEREKAEAELTEVQRVQAAADKASAELAQARARIEAFEADNALLRAAEVAGLKNPSLYLRLVDRSKIDRTSDGQVTGADEALAALKALEPSLFNNGAPTQTANAATGAGKGSDRQVTDPATGDRALGRELAKAAQSKKPNWRI